MIALIHIYCSTSLCVIYKSLLIHDIQVLIYRGSTNERLPGEGMAHDSYYNETDRVTPFIHSYCYIAGLGLDCKFIDLLIKRSINIFIKISLYLNFIVLEIISKQTDTLI